MLGFSQSIYWAVGARCICGLFNGNEKPLYLDYIELIQGIRERWGKQNSSRGARAQFQVEPRKNLFSAWTVFCRWVHPWSFCRWISVKPSRTLYSGPTRTCFPSISLPSTLFPRGNVQHAGHRLNSRVV